MFEAWQTAAIPSAIVRVKIFGFDDTGTTNQRQRIALTNRESVVMRVCTMVWLKTTDAGCDYPGLQSGRSSPGRKHSAQG